MPLIKGAKISLPPINQAAQITQQQPQQQDNLFLRGLAQLGQGAAEGGAGLLGLPGTLDEYISGQTILPTSQSLTGHVQSAAQRVLPESYLKPQGYEEKFLRNVGSSLPGAAIALGTGGAALPIGVATAGGAAGETVAQELGAGPIGQIAGSLLGSAASTKGFHKLLTKYKVKPQNLLATAETAQKNLYDKEKQLGATINAPAKDYEKNLANLEKRINKSSALTSSHKSELLDKIKLAVEDIKNGEINASDLITRKQENNAFYRQLSGHKNQKAREYLDQIQKVIFEEGESIGKKHPEWLSSWKSGDDITKVLKYGDRLEELAEEAPKLKTIINHPLAKTILNGSGLGGGLYLYAKTGSPLALALGAGFHAGTRILDQTKYLKRFLDYPATQNILADASKYAINRQAPQLIKAFHKLNVDAEKFEQKHPEVKQEIKALTQPQSQPSGRLIKGKKL